MEKEKNCRIRAMTEEDLDSVAKIWLDTNVEVHSFIPSEYWKENLTSVKGMFLQAEMYVYEENGEILENAPTQEFFTQPKSERAVQFLSKILNH